MDNNRHTIMIAIYPGMYGASMISSPPPPQMSRFDPPTCHVSVALTRRLQLVGRKVAPRAVRRVRVEIEAQVGGPRIHHPCIHRSHMVKQIVVG